jgi:hypothetical protein
MSNVDNTMLYLAAFTTPIENPAMGARGFAS